MERNQAVIERFSQDIQARFPERTVKHKAQVLKEFFETCQTDYDRVQIKDIKGWVLGQREAGVKLKTLQATVTTLKEFYKDCIMKSLVPTDPSQEIGWMSGRDSLPVLLDRPTFAKLRKLTLKKPRQRAILELLYSTGVRVSELVSIRLVDINWNIQQVSIQGAKGMKERCVPFSSECAVRLKSYLASRKVESPYFFSNGQGKRLTASLLNWQFRQYSKTLKTKITPFTFRLTFAVHLAQEQKSSRYIRELMGYSDLNATHHIYELLGDNEARKDDDNVDKHRNSVQCCRHSGTENILLVRRSKSCNYTISGGIDSKKTLLSSKKIKKLENTPGKSIEKRTQDIVKQFLNDNDMRLTESTRKGYGHALREFFATCSVGYDEVKAKDIRGWMAKLDERHLKLGTIQTIIVAVKSFYRYCMEENLILKNPCVNIRSPKRNDWLPVYLDKEAFTKLREISKNELRERAMIETLYATGVRISELLNIRLEDIEWGTRKIWIHKGKGNKERFVLYTGDCEAWMKEYLAKRKLESPYLFINRWGRPLNRNRVSVLFQKYSQTLNLEIKITPHTLRHTFAAHLAEKGMPQSYIQELLGHVDINTTEIYSRLNVLARKKQYDQYQ